VFASRAFARTALFCNLLETGCLYYSFRFKQHHLASGRLTTSDGRTSLRNSIKPTRTSIFRNALLGPLVQRLLAHISVQRYALPPSQESGPDISPNLESISGPFLFQRTIRTLPGRSQSGPRRSGDAAVLDEEVLQVLTRSAAASISWKPEREGIMSSLHADPPRLRLDPTSYERLRQQVLRRDGWKCQACGRMSNLEVHPKRFRSQSGDDADHNLITLCTACHAVAHLLDGERPDVEVVGLWQNSPRWQIMVG
jgi:hypothetical protein